MSNNSSECTTVKMDTKITQHNDDSELVKHSNMLFLVMEYLFYPVFKVLYLVWYLPMVLIGMCRRKRVCVPANDLPEVMMLPAVELAMWIANRKVSCRFAVEAYISRIKEVNPILNAVVEERFDAALLEADSVDHDLQTSTKPPKEWLKDFPFLGVPLTVKESIGVAQMPNTSGHVPVKDRRASKDAEIVASARKAGMIILAVTNTPELCMNWETYNNISGMTCNPYDSRKTCGGSSGGEGALLGAGASVVGLGSDIAGSLRLPANFCGVFSHKPTAHVVSTIGHYPDCADLERWESHFSLGPMCRYAKDLLPMMRVITKDQFKPMMNYSKEVDIATTKIYFHKNFGSILVSNMESQQSTAFDFLLDHFKIKYNLQVEPLRKTIFKNTFLPMVHVMAKIQNITYEKPRNTFLELIKAVFGCSKYIFTIFVYQLVEKYGSKMSDSLFRQCESQMDTLRNELETLLGEDGVLLMPVVPLTAGYLYTTLPKFVDTVNCFLLNIMGMPVSTCPLGRHTNGIPFGIQVVSKRFNDKLSMVVAEEIEKICGGWNMPQKQ